MAVRAKIAMVVLVLCVLYFIFRWVVWSVEVINIINKCHAICESCGGVFSQTKIIKNIGYACECSFIKGNEVIKKDLVRGCGKVGRVVSI